MLHSLIYNDLTIEELLAEIEKKRDMLVGLGMDKGLQDAEVISVSKQLDLLINQYYLRVYENMS